MKFVAPLFLIVLFSLSLSAQIIKPAEKTSEQTSEVWQDFMPAEEEFRLESPGTATLRYDKTADDKLPPHRSYLALSGGTYYFIFSDPIDKPFQNQMVSGFVKSQVSADLQTGEIYSFDDNFGYHHTVLTMKNAAHVYTFQAVSLSKTSASVKRFFDSIRVKGILIRPAEKVSMMRPPNRQSISCYADGYGSSGSPSQTVQLDIVERKPADLSTEDKIQGIKFLSKPRAKYTDYARFYGIQGDVILRLSFLADERIGSASTVKGLPFGLTEESLEATCKLKFEPALKNAVPYSVTKQIIYNFSLF